MSKKIQVSTVKQTADVQVLFINTSLITKALRADMASKEILSKLTDDYNAAIKPRTEQIVDEDGNIVADENGNPKTKPVLDKNGNQVYDYSYMRMDAKYAEMFHTQIAPFLKELMDAFDEAE